MGAHLNVHESLNSNRSIMKFTRLFAALLFSSLLMQTAIAQVTATASPAPKTDELTAGQLELERKALALLDEIIGEIPSLKLVENRIRLQATAAELLWPREQERARELFNAAATELAAVTASIDPDDQQQYHNHTNMASQLRQRMLGIIAPRDPKLALEFLRATRQPPPPVQPGSNYRQPDQELMLEAQLAQQIAARDPQQALRLAEEILNRGLSSNLVPLLDQLRTRDADGAARLAASMAKKLRTANFATDYEATGIANYLLHTTRPPEIAPGQNGQTTVAANLPDPRRLGLDEAARRELINSLVNAALNTGGNPGQQPGNMDALLSTMRQLMPEVERYAPAQQVAALRRRMENFDRRINPGNPREYRQLMETGTPDALVEAAPKAPPEMRQQLYRTAAFKALSEGNAERARQIINSNVDNSQMRQQWLKEIDQQLFWRAASEGNIEQAQVVLARIKSIEERVGMLVQMARVLSGKGNKQAAEKFLDEAWNLIGGHAKTQTQFSVQLYLAQAYAPIAPARSFEIMEAGVTRLNELIAAAAVLEGFGQEAFAQDELKTQDGYLWGSFVTQCSETLAALAPVDFEHARSLADKFQRSELRLPSRLAVVRGILLKEGERNNSNRGPLRRGRIAPSRIVTNED